MAGALCPQPLTIAHCYKPCDSQHFWSQMLLYFVPKQVMWQAWCLRFGIFMANPRATRNTRKDTSGCGFSGSWLDFGAQFLPVPWIKKGVYFDARFQFVCDKFLVQIWIWGKRCCTSKLFTEANIRMISEFIFWDCCGFGVYFHDFWCLGDGLEMRRFFRATVKHSQILISSRAH